MPVTATGRHRQRCWPSCRPLFCLLQLQAGTGSGAGRHVDLCSACYSYRQAQAAVLAAMPRLHKLNLPTKRPDDYFAQMAKTDAHMKKASDTSPAPASHSHIDDCSENVATSLVFVGARKFTIAESFH